MPSCNTYHLTWVSLTLDVGYLFTTAPAKCSHLRPRGATPCLRSRAEAGKTPCPKGGGQEELPHVRGQGQWPRVPACDGAGTAERSYPTSKARGGGREELPCIQGQGRRPGGATPPPRIGGFAGAGGPRGAISHSRSEGAAVRRFPSSKVKSSGCALLE